MKHFGFLPVLLLLCIGATAQLPPIVIEKGTEFTSVHTNRLNVIDSPDQFFQIQFFGEYSSNERIPFQLSITLHSFATKALYNLHSHSRLVAYADGEKVPLGLAIYDVWYGKQTMNLSQSVSQPASFPEQITLPAGSKLEKMHSLKAIVMESLVLEPLPFESLLRLAQAQDIEMELGDTRFQLSPIHKDRLRLFTKSITPPNYTMAAPQGKLDTNSNSPSDANQTSLKETMGWLSSTLSSLTVAQGNRKHMDFDSSALLKCQFKYSETNATGSQKISFSSNFQDLDPEAVLISETPSAAILRYATKDSELRVKEDSYSQTAHSQHQEKYLYHARTIDLKKDGHTKELRDAFVHAINLCQSKP